MQAIQYAGGLSIPLGTMDWPGACITQFVPLLPCLPQAHVGPIVALERSPFFEDIILTVRQLCINS
jgi:hypothetical protein